MNHQQSIAAGMLDIQITRARYALDELITYASRENPKRGFLFVSKVLGKHWPVKPSVMRQTYDDLIQSLLEKNDPTYVVGMAETATGLGAGVADSLARAQSQAVFYQHTTRTMISDQPIWLQLDEAHSHAVDHILYQPEPTVRHDIQQVQRLVLVDDEISTGRTLHLLAAKLKPLLPKLTEVVVVSLVNWLDECKVRQFDDLGIAIRFVSLFEGQFTFTPADHFQPSLPQGVDREVCHKPSRLDLGRVGLKMPYSGPLPQLDISLPLTVLGCGEHLYLPFLCAEQAEQRGQDVLFQSTTRSPILLGDGITSKLEFHIDARPIVHYLYNFDATQRQTMMFLEDEEQRESHQLAKHYPLITEVCCR